VDFYSTENSEEPVAGFPDLHINLAFLTGAHFLMSKSIPLKTGGTCCTVHPFSKVEVAAAVPQTVIDPRP
jgi:hypothetical protein